MARLQLVKLSEGGLALQGTGDPSRRAEFSIYDLDGEGGDPFAYGARASWRVVPEVDSCEYDPNDDATFWAAHETVLQSARDAGIDLTGA